MTHELSALGWGPFFEEQWRGRAPADLVPARIAAEQRGAYEVWAQDGSGRAKLAGRLRHELATAPLPGVGDWVLLDAVPGEDRTAIIRHVLDRRTVFTRGSPGREAGAQVIAANVDVVFVVCGLDSDFNLRRIERYLARVFASGAEPAVLLSKADLCEDPAARVAEVEARAPGVEVQAISAPRGSGLEPIRARLGPGVTGALVGSSGAGKSTLLNALLGEQRFETGELRRDGRGRHTTTHRQLVPLLGGGLLLDTPGMRELQLLDEAGLADAFEDVAALAERCRFSDCGHGAEPGCAVTSAVEQDALEPERLEHFLQLRREALAYERRHDERLRRIDERAWGKLTREVRLQTRLKRGE